MLLRLHREETKLPEGAVQHREHAAPAGPGHRAAGGESTLKRRHGEPVPGNDSAPPPQLLSLLLEALTCPDQGVQLSTLSCLEPVIASPPPVLLQQLEAVVGRLLGLVCSPAMVSRSLKKTLSTKQKHLMK